MSRKADPSKPKKSFGDIFAKYKTYDPTVEGHGSPDEWRGAFYDRMGFDEAQKIISGQEDTPLGLLGLGPKATWDDIRKAFKTKIRQWHPDLNPGNKEAEEMSKKIIAAYTILEKQFGK